MLGYTKSELFTTPPVLVSITAIYFQSEDCQHMKAAIKWLMPEPLKQLYRSWSQQPFQQPITSCEETIAELADYLQRQPQVYLDRMGWMPAEISGKTILILGPGNDLFSALILAGYGAKIILVEKYPVAWNPNIQPELFRRLAIYARTQFAGADLGPLERFMTAQSYDIPDWQFLTCGLEEVTQVADNSVDVSLSNAVFEHLYNPQQAIEQLYRITKPQGVGHHQIDLRWHRDFSRPLEYCTLSEVDFRILAEECHYECGNRLRYTEFQNIFADAGFIVDQFSGNLFAEIDYLEDVLTRSQPKFQQMDREALRILSGQFSIRKP